jgi:hypothetical protein
MSVFFPFKYTNLLRLINRCTKGWNTIFVVYITISLTASCLFFKIKRSLCYHTHDWSTTERVVNVYTRYRSGTPTSAIATSLFNYIPSEIDIYWLPVSYQKHNSFYRWNQKECCEDATIETAYTTTVSCFIRHSSTFFILLNLSP